MLQTIIAGGLMTALLGTAAVAPSATEPVVIDVVSVSGTGCLPGTTGVSRTPDGASVVIDFGSFVAQVGPETPRTDARKACQFTLRIHPPTGYTYLLGAVRHVGSVSLAEGATGTVRTISFHQGQGTPTVQTYTFAGPSNEELAIDDLPTQVAAPCGALRDTNLNVDLRVNAGTSDTTTTTSSLALQHSLILPVTLLPCQ